MAANALWTERNLNAPFMSPDQVPDLCRAGAAAG